MMQYDRESEIKNIILSKKKLVSFSSDRKDHQTYLNNSNFFYIFEKENEFDKMQGFFLD